MLVVLFQIVFSNQLLILLLDLGGGGVEIINLFSLQEYLLHRGKEFMYQFIAVLGKILLLHLLKLVNRSL